MNTQSADVTVQPDVIYAHHDEEALAGDYYLPAGEGPFPLLIACPGGGWMMSNRKSYRDWGMFLAARGIAVFSIQYRVARGTKMFPEAVRDVVAAVRHARAHAGDHNVDPDRIGILGSSAGAHVGSLAALSPDDPLFRDTNAVDAGTDISASVKTFLGIYGVYDMFALWQQEIANAPNLKARRSEALLGATPFEDQQLYFDASPLKHIRADNKMPVLLSYGTQDSMVGHDTQSLPFQRALKQAGFMVRDFPMDGAGHFWFSEEPVDEPGSQAAAISPHLLRFLQKHL